MGNKIFQNVSGVKPGRSVFNLSYSKLFDCHHGELIPIMADEMVPGDTFKLGNEIVVRLQPLVSPVLHEINVYVHYFFVPYRLLWTEPNGWQTFISGGPDGTAAPTLPRWSPTNRALYSLWDYLGFPIGIVPTGALPIKFPMNAYNLIYNEYYRDETQIAAVSLDQESILKRAWEKDYFTSALPWLQRGTAPALPFSGSAVWAGDVSLTWPAVDAGATTTPFNYRSTNFYPNTAGTKSALELGKVTQAAMNANTLTTATFGVNDLRLAFQIQKFLERNARAGARYVEFLKAHFGVSPRDERLQRPEYIGGSKSPIILSEVLQTSASGITGSSTKLGNLAGHGITADKNYVGTYTATEFGCIMGILSVMPRSMYSQGIDKQWLRTTKYDFYFPEFAHLSEQAIIRAELYANGVSGDNNTIFGYQGRYDEMRTKKNMAVSDMAYGQSLAYWTLAREFASAPGLNQTFIECDGSTASQCRIFASGTTAPGYIVHVANIIKAIRPIPVEGFPGLIDHA